ncbi:hypothetical protein PSTT_09245, partial [Puccinia striiformis]
EQKMVKAALAKEQKKRSIKPKPTQARNESRNLALEDIDWDQKDVKDRAGDNILENKPWLNKLDHGQVIANTYQRPIVFISMESSATFIPSVWKTNLKKQLNIYNQELKNKKKAK